ncbi:MAG: hypothetical protein NUW24_06595 [Anaerolineae bacterium]|nr:hypothetical protein [Anaerolineae bacterium]MDH7472784.1 hypothetical protein [Anaerolineae bacterium]
MRRFRSAVIVIASIVMLLGAAGTVALLYALSRYATQTPISAEGKISLLVPIALLLTFAVLSVVLICRLLQLILQRNGPRGKEG